MPTIQQIALIVTTVNLASFLIFGIDKILAKTGNRRISEKALLLTAVPAASPGALLGMVLFNHKTSKAKFRYGIPALLGIQAAVFYWLAYA